MVNSERLEFREELKVVLILFAVSMTAYLPAFDNGFISDDLVILDRTLHFPGDFQYLFTIPPDGFRLTSYLVFWIVKSICGYRAEAFYLVVLLIHVVNSYLLFRLLRAFDWNRTPALSAGLFYCCIQNPQEAVMWLSAMNEPLATMGILLSLHQWKKGRIIPSLLAFVFALFSKESAIVALPLLLLLEFSINGRVQTRRRFYLFPVLTIPYLALFVFSLSHHSMLDAGYYSLGFHSVGVFFHTLHKLFFPLVYLLTVVWVLAGLRPPNMKLLLLTGSSLVLAISPYLFLTYQNFLPSRQLYLACMPLSILLAHFSGRLSKPSLQKLFMAAFLVVNIGYIWIVKDTQFEARAAPSGELVKILQELEPQRLHIVNFPLNPWIAKLSTRLVDGWEPEMIVVNSTPGKEKVYRWSEQGGFGYVQDLPPKREVKDE